MRNAKPDEGVGNGPVPFRTMYRGNTERHIERCIQGIRNGTGAFPTGNTERHVGRCIQRIRNGT